MLGRRFVPTLVTNAKLLKPIFPLVNRGFSDAAEKPKESGDPEVVNFIKKANFVIEC